MRVDFHIRADVLRAARLFVSRAASMREALDGVIFEFLDASHVLVLGTDGRRLLAVREAVSICKAGEGDVTGRVFVMQAEMIDSMLAAHRREEEDGGPRRIEVEFSDCDELPIISLHAKYSGVKIEGIGLPGEIPNYRKVCASLGDGPLPLARDVHVDGNLLAAFTRAGEILDNASGSLMFFRAADQPGGVMLVHWNNSRWRDCVSLLMPMRGEVYDASLPAWALAAKG